MKIMTLNTHSLAEPEYESKLAAFAGSLVQIKPDIIALQEVNQSRSAPPAASGRLRESGYVPCCAKDLSTASPCASRAVIRTDNHALNLALLLARARSNARLRAWLSVRMTAREAQGEAVLKSLAQQGT